MTKKKHCYLIDKLLEEKWFENEKEAAPWLLARRILINERPAHSLKERISTESIIRVREYYKRDYVSKGGIKLAYALNRFQIDIARKTALDCGASTGGFTDCLLKFGAGKVYAVDAGHGQLAGTLLTNPKVVNMERTNLSASILRELDPAPDIITLDLSYLSLVKAIPICKDIFQKREGLVLCLIKPLFEVDSSEIKRSGNINDRGILRDTLTSLCHHLNNEHVAVTNLINSPITGNNGTYEYFAEIKINSKDKSVDLSQAIDRAIENSFGLSKFDKSN